MFQLLMGLSQCLWKVLNVSFQRHPWSLHSSLNLMTCAADFQSSRYVSQPVVCTAAFVLQLLHFVSLQSELEAVREEHDVVKVKMFGW